MIAGREGLGAVRGVMLAVVAAAIVQGCAGVGADGAPGATDDRVEHTWMPGVSTHAFDVSGLAAREAESDVSMDATSTTAMPVVAGVVAAQVAGHARFVVGYDDASTLLGRSNAPMPAQAMSFAYSDDGQTWNRAEVTGLDRISVPVAATLGSPALAADRDGPDVYYAALAVRAGYSAQSSRLVVVAHSTDGGATFLPPMIATMPQFGVDWSTADAPTLTIDAGGTVHLVFVSDQGTPAARIQHWTGSRDVEGCTSTCMPWRPATPPAIDPADAPYIRHPVLRAYHLTALYLAYEVRAPLPAATGGTGLRVALRRYDPLNDAWTPTDVQPGDGAVYPISGPLADGGARMDLAVDPHEGSGLVVWAGASPTAGPGARESVYAQRFHFVDVYTESWSRAVVVSSAADALGTTTFQPTASLAGAVRAVTWFEHDGAGRARLMGARSDDDGATYASARNLTQLGRGEADASMPLCATSAGAWRGFGTSITALDAHGTPRTLTLHVGTRDPSCASTAAPGLAATVWGGETP